MGSLTFSQPNGLPCSITERVGLPRLSGCTAHVKARSISPLNRSLPIRLSRGRQQMHMVGHQHISVNLATLFARCVNHAIEVEAVVLLGKEGRLTVIAPLDNVLRHVREIQPVSSWHGSSSFSCVSFASQGTPHGKVTMALLIWESRVLPLRFGMQY